MSLTALAADDYQLGPDSQRKEGTPRGKVQQFKWTSKIFAGTIRDVWIYTPAGYDGKTALPFMVFQDGGGMVAEKRAYRVPVVFDNLIHSRELPAMAGIFINPGMVPPARKGGQARKNRSFEYDTLSDQYVRFLLEEILPEVQRRAGLKLTNDPAGRAICGNSSGGICAFTAAWERPDQFGKVLGWVGTFVDIRGANAYPSLIRKTERKPIRAALLGETNDLDNKFGNWPLANRQMETALAFMDYDYRYWWGDGFHGSRHAAVMLPEMLKWLWSE